MKKASLIFILINSLFSNFCFCQNNYPSLYNDKGVLLFDSTYRIDNFESLPVVIGKEKKLNYIIISNISYPLEALNNGISGKLILKLELRRVGSSNEFELASVISVSDTLSILTNNLIKQVNDTFGKVNFYQLNEYVEFDSYNFYIPFEFDFTINDNDPFKLTVEISSANSYKFNINYNSW